MKKLLFLLVFFIPLNLFSQLANTTYVIPTAGFSFPTNKTDHHTSFNTGAALEFAVTKLTTIGFETNAAHISSRPYEISFHVASMDAITAFDIGSYTTIGLMPYVKLQNADAVKLPVQPFIKLGAGASFMAKTGASKTSYTVVYDLPNETSTGFLFAASLGTNLMINSKNKFVIEAQYRMNKSNSDDIRLFLFNIGYAFRI